MREYKTQMEAAKKGIITPEMQTVAAKEYMEPEKLRELVAKGWVAIPANVNHTSLSAEGVGSGLKPRSTLTWAFPATARTTPWKCRRSTWR